MIRMQKPNKSQCKEKRFPTLQLLANLNAEMNKTARISGQSPECSDYPLIRIKYFLGKENNGNP